MVKTPRTSAEPVLIRESMLAAIRVACVIPAYRPAREFGGPVSKLEALARELSPLLDLEIWAADYGEAGSRVTPGRRTIDEIHTRHLRTIARYRWSPLVVGVRNSFRDFRPDIVHCFGYRDGLTLSAAGVARRRGIPYIVEPLGIYTLGQRSAFAKRVIDATFSQWYFNGASALIATARTEASDFEGLNPPIVLRPNPVRLPPGDIKLTERRPSPPYQIGWIGRLSLGKNLDTLLSAVERIPACHLTFVGPDDRDGASRVIRALVEEFGLSQRVTFAGPKYGRDLLRIVGRFDVVVNCSHRESFGNAIAEAAAAGVVCVATRSLGAAEVLEPLGAVTIVGSDASALAAGIERALKHYPSVEERRRFAAAVRAVLSPASVAQSQYAIYKRVLHGSTN